MGKITRETTVWTRKKPHRRGVVEKVFMPLRYEDGAIVEGESRTYNVAFNDDNGSTTVREICKPAQLTMTRPDSKRAKHKREMAKQRRTSMLVHRIRTNDPSLKKLDLVEFPRCLWGTGKANFEGFLEALQANTTIEVVRIGDLFLPPGDICKVGPKQLKAIIPALGSPSLKSFTLEGVDEFTSPVELDSVARLLQASPALETLVLEDVVLVGETQAYRDFCTALASHPSLRKVNLGFRFCHEETTGGARNALFRYWDKYTQNLDFDQLVMALANIKTLREVELRPVAAVSLDSAVDAAISLASIAALCQTCEKLVFSPDNLRILGGEGREDFEKGVLCILRESKIRELIMPFQVPLSEASCKSLAQMLRDGSNTTLTKLDSLASMFPLLSWDNRDLFAPSSYKPEIEFFLTLNRYGRHELLVDNDERAVPAGLWPHVFAKVGSMPGIVHYFLRAVADEIFDEKTVDTVDKYGVDHGEERPEKRAKLSVE